MMRDAADNDLMSGCRRGNGCPVILKQMVYWFREGISGNQLKVDVADILSYDDDLAKYVEENPSESLPLVRSSPRAPVCKVHNKMLFVCLTVHN